MNAVRLVPGRDGKGAVLQDFVDPVAPHDILVRKCEEKMDEIDALRPSNVVRFPVRAPTVLTGLVGAMMDIAASGAVLPPCDTEAR